MHLTQRSLNSNKDVIFKEIKASSMVRSSTWHSRSFSCSAVQSPQPDEGVFSFGVVSIPTEVLWAEH
ncbi:hypothetical protein FRX31_008546 [Thalictrum thalictroides]|uniref:Uncharacterized protein n=1 Tax=Thalictrum thalictroides TaxID=46969 RepID=A0A7J6WY65_THATH|nr:hypothetical protein FRX31_008546 [Thalictrum thalictroides]